MLPVLIVAVAVSSTTEEFKVDKYRDDDDHCCDEYNFTCCTCGCRRSCLECSNGDDKSMPLMSLFGIRRAVYVFVDVVNAKTCLLLLLLLLLL
jgi:hypothetical protein